MQIKTLKEDEVDKLASPMELDLVAMFSLLQESILSQLNEGKTPEQIIQDIEDLFGGSNE
jgi:hypothetical protein